MRVVLDTNILISACWKRDGLEGRTVKLALNGILTACVSDPVLEEYREVLARKKFAAHATFAAQLLHEIETKAFRVTPTAVVTAATDPDDNRFLECAEAAQASYVITGNLSDFPAQWGVTRIANARDFLTVFAPQLLT